MRILLLLHSFNNLTQRLHVELCERSHEVSVELDIHLEHNVWSTLLSGMQVFLATVPPYWLATILLVVFAIQLRILPVIGGNSPIGLVLPTIALALELSGFLGQIVLSEFTRVLEQPFVMSSRARCMGELGVRLRHVLRRAALPGITLSGWAIGKLLSGAVLIEAVFARQGLGGVLVAATSSRDVPVVSGAILISAGLFAITYRRRSHLPDHRSKDQHDMSRVGDLSMSSHLGEAPQMVRHAPLRVYVALIIIGFFVVAATALGLLQTHDPLASDLTATLQAPSLAHWFGTDQSGRDLYSRIVEGAGQSLTIGFGATALSISIAVVFGLVARLLGGALDNVLSGFWTYCSHFRRFSWRFCS